MKQSKKFGYNLIQDGGNWSVEIVRRVSAKKTVVSKRENGFTSEADAEKWGKAEVETFLKKMNINDQKKRRARNNEPDEDIV